MKDDVLNNLQKLHSATTPGPWSSFIEGRDHVSGSDFIQTAGEDIDLYGATREDQDFIAAMHEATPHMLRELRELTEENQLLKINLLNIASDSFNNSLRFLNQAGVIDEKILNSKYKAGTDLYNDVTNEIQKTIERFLQANEIST